MTPGPIVLFDGVCNFCNAGVNFILSHDHAARVRFASLQSPAGQSLLQQLNLPPDRFDSMVLVERGRPALRSTAALRVARYLDPPWPILTALLLVPTFLRDAAYDLLAANRYRWFGRLDACQVPTPEVRQRFLDGPA
ncbi:MAG: thiol-disulfide oxidoreductase DCC family protein [Gemmataceae bacterium]